MSGPFVSASSPDRIAEYFGAAFEGETLGENYNVAPTNDIYAVIAGRDGEPRLEVFHWGPIPVWAKEAKVGQKMINARAETPPPTASTGSRSRTTVASSRWTASTSGRRGTRRTGHEVRQAGEAADVRPPP